MGSNLRYGLVLLLSGLCLQTVLAANILSSTGFSNCANNATIKVDNADIEFNQQTGIVTFAVSGTSTEVQKVNAALVVTAYGQQVYQKTFDPCASGTLVTQLCPVPSGTFSANGSQTIPAQYLSMIPSIAFSIPDLDGDATLTLTSAGDGAEVGCIQSGVSNGKSLSLGAVSYVAAGVAGAALVIAGISSVAGAAAGAGAGVGAAPQSVGFTTMFSWFQTVSVTGMMSVQTPSIYRSFSSNFAFSTGLIPWTQMQIAIDNFRSSTGGNLTDDNVQFLQNTTLAFGDGESNTTTTLSRRGLYRYARDINFGAGNGSAPIKPGSTIQQDVYGIGGYVEQLMIPQANTFMTVLLIFAIVVAVIAVGILLLKVILEFWALFGSFPKRLTSFRKRYWRLLANTITSLIFLLYGLWVTWCIFQFTDGDSWAAKILAAVTLGIFTAILGFFSIQVVLIARKYKKADGDASALYENKETWVKYSMFYESYKKSYWWAFIPIIVIMFARGCILAAGNGHGLEQTAAQLFVETFALIFLLWTRPFATPAGNWINIIIQVVRVMTFVCVLVFVEQLGIAETTKTVTGVVLIAVQAVLTGLLVILMAVNAIIACCRENPHRKQRKEREKMAREFDNLTPLDARNSLLLRDGDNNNNNNNDNKNTSIDLPMRMSGQQQQQHPTLPPFSPNPSSSMRAKRSSSFYPVIPPLRNMRSSSTAPSSASPQYAPLTPIRTPYSAVGPSPYGGGGGGSYENVNFAQQGAPFGNGGAGAGHGYGHTRDGSLGSLASAGGGGYGYGYGGRQQMPIGGALSPQQRYFR